MDARPFSIDSSTCMPTVAVLISYQFSVITNGWTTDWLASQFTVIHSLFCIRLVSSVECEVRIKISRPPTSHSNYSQ